MRLFGVGVFWVVVSFGCGGDDTVSPSTDNTSTTDSPAQRALCEEYPSDVACPTLPAPARPPRLDDGTDMSQWEPSVCGDGFIPSFGRVGCIALGTPCPSGLWPEDLPSGEVRYVTPGGVGDGRTKEGAAGSIQAMLDASDDGATIVLSKGSFDEAVRITKQQNLVGACVSETMVVAPASAGATLELRLNGESTIRDLAVTGSSIGLHIHGSTTSARLAGVRVGDVWGAGLLVEAEAEVSADGLRVGNVAVGEDGSGGKCVEATSGSRLTLGEVLLEDCASHGLRADGGTTVINVSNAVVQRSGNVDGAAVWLINGVSTTFRKVLIAEARSIGVAVLGPGLTSLDAEDFVLKTIRLESGDSSGLGLVVQDEVDVALSRVLIQRAARVGLLVVGPGAMLQANDFVVEDTRDAGLQALNVGVGVGPGVTLDIDRMRLSRNVGGGFAAGDRGQKTLRLRNVVIEDSRPGTWMYSGGDGFSVQDQAELFVNRMLLDNNYNVGVLLGLPGVSATLEDIVITNTKMNYQGWGGAGISLQDGADVTMRRVLLDGNHENGLGVLYPGTRVQVEDLLVQNTRSISNGLQGIGIGVQEGSLFTMTRGVVRDNRSSGILALGESTSLTLRSVQITGTRVAACGEMSGGSCPMAGEGFGDGILVLGDVSLDMSNFIIENNARVGVYLYETTGSGLDNPPNMIFGKPTVNIRAGSIVGNAYGINFRDGDVGPSDFAGKDVACYDNVQTVDGCYSEIGLDVPNPAEILQGVTPSR